MRLVMHYLSACSITIRPLDFDSSKCSRQIQFVEVCSEPQWHRLIVENKKKKKEKKMEKKKRKKERD